MTRSRASTNARRRASAIAAAALSLAPARALRIVRRGPHHAVVEGLISPEDVARIRAAPSERLTLANGGRESSVGCFDLASLPALERTMAAAIREVCGDRGWPPLGDFAWCEAQHCSYGEGGKFDWHARRGVRSPGSGGGAAEI